MNGNDLEAQVRHQLLTYVGPGILVADLVHISQAQSSSKIRTELRRRGLTSLDDEMLAKTPIEHRLVFQLPSYTGSSTDISRYRKVIVYVDVKGQVLDAIESR